MSGALFSSVDIYLNEKIYRRAQDVKNWCCRAFPFAEVWLTLILPLFLAMALTLVTYKWEGFARLLTFFCIHTPKDKRKSDGRIGQQWKAGRCLHLEDFPQKQGRSLSKKSGFPFLFVGRPWKV